MRDRYAGADWLESLLKYAKPDMAISETGRRVADLLGQLYLGIYHIEERALLKVEWPNNRFMSITLRNGFSTTDFDGLTQLVFLAHHMCLRVHVDGVKSGYIKLSFHARKRSGDYSERHPTLGGAVSNFKAWMIDAEIQEYQDKE
jgi:hypothetical protein